MAIKSFTGEYRFLSNFYPCVVQLDGIDYPSTEHAYQAAKTLDFDQRIPFRTGTAAEAKKRGSHLKLREDWEEVKLEIMESLLQQKFCQGSDLQNRLNQTRGTKLEEGNWWHDNFWGSCDCNKRDECKRGGKNHLGKILMKIRDRL
jgi:ribA/ribD-fused uncharacterized protein